MSSPVNFDNFFSSQELIWMGDHEMETITDDELTAFEAAGGAGLGGAGASPVHESSSDSESSYSPLRDDFCLSPLPELELVTLPVVQTPQPQPQPAAGFVDWSTISLIDEIDDVDVHKDNMFGSVAPAMLVQLPRDYIQAPVAAVSQPKPIVQQQPAPAAIAASPFSSASACGQASVGLAFTSVGVSTTPANVFGEPNLGQTFSDYASQSHSAVPSVDSYSQAFARHLLSTHEQQAQAPLPSLATAAVQPKSLAPASASVSSAASSANNSKPIAQLPRMASVVNAKPVMASSASTTSASLAVQPPVPVTIARSSPAPSNLSSEDEDSADRSDEKDAPRVADDEAAVADEEDEPLQPHECAQCAKLVKTLRRDPKTHLGDLDDEDKKNTDEAYEAFQKNSAGMTADQKASHIDLFFKLRDIKALRKLVGIHNKSHFTATKPLNVESTTRLLGQKFKLTLVCVEDCSIPLKKFLKAKKAAGRSKPSRSARQAHAKDTTKPKASARFQPY